MKLKIFYALGIFLFVLFCLMFFIWWQPPADFPSGTIFSVSSGSGLTLTARNLYNKKIIRSEFWFKSFLVLFGGPKGLVAGDYVLNQNQAIFALAYRFSNGDYRLTPIKVTVPEGLNVKETAKLISQKFPEIDPTSFVILAQPDEGYLFPDTYFFLPNISAEEIINIMKDNFQSQITGLQIAIALFNRPLSDIIKMASIIEEEARTKESREIISGILWKRLDENMLLQVDSSFKYINGKNTSNLTLADLKIDSPYNSYLYKGLPPTPITNPGLDSIKATISPTETNYYYFLSDKQGNMYYAKTYNEHLHNKELYLK